MITISRKLARQLRVVFSRGLGITARNTGPAVEFRTSSQGTSIRTANGQFAIEFLELGNPADEEIFALPFELLRQCEGPKNEPVSLRRENATVTAEWADSGIPQTAQFDVVQLPAFPPHPESFATNEPDFLNALRDAVDTSDPEPTRYALNGLRLRGSDGQIAATDGRQMLIQSGFTFPWDDALLVPANRLLTSGDLATGEQVEIGRTDDWVVLRSGPWTVWLKIDHEARFPNVDDHLRPVSDASSTLHLSDSDSEFLAKAVKRLPAREEFNAPITLDLNGAVSLRAKAADQPAPMELVLTGSRRDGEAIRLTTNRNYLSRAARLGFRSVHIFGQEVPVACQDQHRTYMWAVLEKNGIVQSDPDATRIESPPSARTPSRKGQQENMNRANQSEDSHRKRRPKKQATAESASVIAQAEALRDTLAQARTQARDLISSLKRQRRQSKSLQSALSSIRQLQTVDV